MSNNPNQPGDFGSKQFQKIQFGHKPHEEIKTDDVEREIRERIEKPARLLKSFALLSLALTFVLMVGYCGYLAVQRDSFVQSWNQKVLADFRARKRTGARAAGEMSKKEEEEIKSQTDWNKNSYTILLGFNIVSFFLFMVFAAFIAVSAHKMANLTGYTQGIVACIMSLIPFISPLVILGIPLAIWLLKILMEPDVKRAFALMKS